MDDLIIIGGGGHAKALIGAIRTMGGFAIKGVVDGQLVEGDEVSSCSVLGDDSVLDEGRMKGVYLVVGVGIIKADESRKRLYDKFKSQGYEFATIKHSSSVIADSANVSEGAQIMAGAIIQPHASIGENVIVNTSAVVEHDCEIEGHCHIAPGSILGGGVVVGECSMIGMGARVLPGLKIGRGVTVGAGAVVTEDVEDGRTVVGVPAS